MEHLPAADKSANAIQQTNGSLKELEGGCIPRESEELWAGPTQASEACGDQRPSKDLGWCSTSGTHLPFAGEKMPTKAQGAYFPTCASVSM